MSQLGIIAAWYATRASGASRRAPSQGRGLSASEFRSFMNRPTYAWQGGGSAPF